MSVTRQAEGWKKRCVTCGLGLAHCLCDHIVPIDTTTHVTVVMHSLETRRASNSGKLLHRSLSASSIKYYGRADGPLDLSEAVKPGHRNILLYPVTQRTAPPEGDEPLNLIVPDGNWRQAAKIARLLIEAEAVTPVALPYKAPSRYRLRSAPTRPEGLATFEACARFLGTIEGLKVEEALLAIFDEFVTRHLRARAKLGREPRILPGAPPDFAARIGFAAPRGSDDKLTFNAES